MTDVEELKVEIHQMYLKLKNLEEEFGLPSKRACDLTHGNDENILHKSSNDTAHGRAQGYVTCALAAFKHLVDEENIKYDIDELGKTHQDAEGFVI